MNVNDPFQERWFRQTSHRKCMFPTADDSNQYKEIFRKRAGNRVKTCPSIIGAIDGIHIEIRPPRETAAVWVNWKQYPSSNVQAVADGNSKFMDVYIGAPGSVHDARVFSTSRLINKITPNFIILGKWFMLY